MAVEIAVVKEKVQTYIRELVGSFEVDQDGDYTFRRGSSRIFISVDEVGEHAFISLFSILARNVPESPELFEFVAMESGQYRFGSVYIHRQPENGVQVMLSHGLLGDFLDPDELKLAIVLLSGTADELDTEIVGKFGGTTFHEDE